MRNENSTVFSTHSGAAVAVELRTAAPSSAGRRPDAVLFAARRSAPGPRLRETTSGY